MPRTFALAPSAQCTPTSTVARCCTILSPPPLILTPPLTLSLYVSFLDLTELAVCPNSKAVWVYDTSDADPDNWTKTAILAEVRPA